MATAVGATARELPPLETARRRLTKAELSHIISFSRITLIVGLVFLHYGSYPNVSVSPFKGVVSQHFETAIFVNSFVLFFFSVVPLLSMISGWLFFQFRDNAPAELWTRIRRRVASLYIPLVLWNLLFVVILLFVFAVDRSNPVLSALNIDFATARPTQYINAIFSLTQRPIGFQFWFVRDLFVTVLVSPLLWVVLRKAPLWGAVVLAAVWFTDFPVPIFFRTDVLFFFYLGGLIRQRDVPLEITRGATLWWFLAHIAAVAIRTFAPHFVGDDALLLELATKPMRLMGVLACWGVFQSVALSTVGTRIARYGGFAFFLHAIHFPLIAGVKVALWSILPAHTQPWMIAHYAITVFLTVSIGMTIGIVLARSAPKQFAFLNGGRLAG